MEVCLRVLKVARPSIFIGKPSIFESLILNSLKRSYNYLINCPKFINTSTLQTIRVKIL